MRGWGANLGAELRARKGELLDQIKTLDVLADSAGLSADEWLQRYSLEASLMEIYKGEELFWQCRGGQKWLLEGDANTAYFQAIANGRRRKCSIPCLWDGETLLEHPEEISAHIYSFYKELFTASPRGGASLAANFWPPEARVTGDENGGLTLPFSPEEVHGAIASMKAGSAPGPDGLPVAFFQKFWPVLRPVIMKMFHEFYIGTLDLARLNYGVITLIPKVVGATDIRQFRPITVINVLERIFAKVCAVRLAPIAERIAHPFQSAFLKGRRIHDGILALQEIVHEVRRRRTEGVFLKLDFQKAYDRLDWSFLRLVLERRGFDDRWCSWIMQLVRTGSTAININGEVGPSFRSSRGVRQGDPISPLLFNLAVDALATILDKARAAGHLRGVVAHLIPGGGVTHLQYADDIMITVEGSDLDIVNLKFLLLCFEEMSGLKINFDKSEVIVMGYSEAEQQRIADNLNCRLATFPIEYLGMPLSDSKVLLTAFDPLMGKVAARAEPWCGRFTSKGSKTVLIDSNLSSLPMYMMGMYILPEGVHGSFDKDLSRFFWQAMNGRQKYHMVKWADICLPKEMGGLGILASRRMNVALMLRWAWRIIRSEGGLWLQLIQAKYLRGVPLLACDCMEGSQFWRSIQKIKHEIRLGLSFSIGNGGGGAMFWLDRWVDGTTLCTGFPHLFAICVDPSLLVAEAVQAGQWNILFRRSLGPAEVLEWANLMATLPPVLGTEPDQAHWLLSPSGDFSVASAYRALCRRPTIQWMAPLWKAPLPLKIKIFVWQLLRDRLPSGTEVLKRHGPGNGLCPLCGVLENGTHILFSCTAARSLWSFVREALGPEWEASDLASFLQARALQTGRQRHLFWLIFAALSWTLWTTRNKMVIERVFLRRASDSFFKFLAFLQHWHPLARQRDQECLGRMLDALQATARRLASPATS